MRDWTVVGIFDAGNTGYNSEIWGRCRPVHAGIPQACLFISAFKLRDSPEFQGFKERIESDPRLTLEAKRETRYYTDQSEMMATFLSYSRLVAYNNLLLPGCCRRHDYYVCGSS